VVGVAYFKFKNPFAVGDRGARRTRQKNAVSNDILKEHRQKLDAAIKGGQQSFEGDIFFDSRL